MMRANRQSISTRSIRGAFVALVTIALVPAAQALAAPTNPTPPTTTPPTTAPPTSDAPSTTVPTSDSTTDSTPPTTDAPDDPAATETVWPLLGPDEPSRDLRGLLPTLGIEVMIPPGDRVAGPATLEIAYRASETLVDSAIAVTVNGRTVEVVSIEPGATTVDVEIPADRLQTGLNSVDLEASLHLEFDEDCPDPRHVARQFTITDASVLRVPLAMDGPLVLADLPASLLPAGLTPDPITISISDPSNAEMMSAAAVLAALVRDTNDLVPIVTSADELAVDGPTIMLATDDEVELGSVTIGRSAEGWPRLDIVGATPADVLEAAMAVAEPTRRATMTRSTATSIAAAPVVESLPRPRRFALSDLGYDDRTMTGPGESGLTYQFDVVSAERPSEVIVEVSAALEATTDDRRVGLVVEFNNVDLGTLSFDETGQIDEEFSIPPSAIRSGTNFMRLRTDFGSIPVSCAQGRPGTDSITVRAATVIDLGGIDGMTRLDLDDLPYVFRAPEDTARLVVVLPNEPTEEERTLAVELAGLLAARDGHARIASAAQVVTEQLVAGDAHLVVLGELSRQPLLRQLALPVPANESSVWLTAPDVAAEARTAPGAVELYRNPAHPEQVVLAITGLNADGARAAARAVLDRDVRREMFQQVALVSADGSSVTPVPIVEAAPVPATTVPAAAVTASAPTTPSDEPDDIKSGGPPVTRTGVIVIGSAVGVGASAFAIKRWRKRTPNK